MRVWGRVFAALYDRVTATAEAAGLREQRRRVVGRVSGRVLEIGSGTGANLDLYPIAEIEQLTLTEPEAPMARRLERKLETWSGRAKAQLVIAAAERLPFESGSYDFVVATLVLCTVADPALALREIRRVLKPGGRLVFLEHVRASDPALARWQDRLLGLNRLVGNGCHCNRRTLESIERAGFVVDEAADERLPKAWRLVRPAIIGVASAPIG